MSVNQNKIYCTNVRQGYWKLDLELDPEVKHFCDIFVFFFFRKI